MSLDNIVKCFCSFAHLPPVAPAMDTLDMGAKKTDQLHPLLEGLGSRVRRRRKELGLSYGKLAAVAGTDGGRILRIEQGERLGNLSINVVAGLAHGLRCRFGWLTTGELPVEPIPEDATAGVFIAAHLSSEKADQLREIAAAIDLAHAPVAQLETTEDDEVG